MHHTIVKTLQNRFMMMMMMMMMTGSKWLEPVGTCSC
jgi:hypothetical protein